MKRWTLSANTISGSESSTLSNVEEHVPDTIDRMNGVPRTSTVRDG